MWHAWRRPDVSLARVHVFGLVLCGRPSIDDRSAGVPFATRIIEPDSSLPIRTSTWLGDTLLGHILYIQAIFLFFLNLVSR